MHEPARTVIAPDRTVTADDLFRMPDDGYRYALVRGELQRMTPAGFKHGGVMMKLALPLGNHIETRRLGVICGSETGFVVERQPDTVLAPDIAFVRADRIPAAGWPETFFDGPADLAVEVRSPGDTRREVAEKAAAWLRAGALAVWTVDPSDASVTIHLPHRTPRRLISSDTLDGAPLMPGFRLPVAKIFPPPAWSRRSTT